MKPLLFLALTTLALLTPANAKDRPPNFVLILADDCTYSDLEIYGGQAKTPHLKKLAEEGMTFSHCFQAAPMCSPTRHCLYTGIYPVKSGAWPNHTEAYPTVKSIAHYLQVGGYRTHLSGKKHIGPEKVFPFEYSGKNNPDLKVVTNFFTECAKEETPFLLIATSNEPHTPWNQGNPAAYPPEAIELSPIQADTPKTRDALARYFAEITYFDSQVGQILAALKTQNLSENTFVIVLSEQGYGMPLAKWTCYDAGLQSGCVVRWPEKVAPASKSAALIEYVDVVPTLLHAAGLEGPADLDGRSFLPVLEGQRERHKTHVFGLQTSRGIHHGPEHFGIRSVRSDRYRYVRNLTPEVTFRNAATRHPVFQSWLAKAKKGDALARTLTHDYQHRPAEELFDCQSDPWNRHNLIDDPALVEIAQELRGELAEWMESQGDNGQPTERQALQRMPGRH